MTMDSCCPARGWITPCRTPCKPRPSKTQIVEVPSRSGPFGARGVGEPPVIPTVAAIANAVAHATGVRMAQTPMTAPRVLEALQER